MPAGTGYLLKGGLRLGTVYSRLARSTCAMIPYSMDQLVGFLGFRA